MTLFRFQKYYFLISIALFAVLVFIATFVSDTWIRPYGGDFLVVIWLYYLIRSLTIATTKQAALAVFTIAVLVETMQYFQLNAHLGIGANTATGIALGSSFDWMDLLLYMLGTVFSVILDRYWSPVA